jgi:hypothetical protein
MEHLSVSINSYSLHHIHGFCDDEETGEVWSLTGIYGFPEEQNKKKTWQLISTLAGEVVGRWLCCGDLNDILDSHDKQGGISRSQGQLALGRQTVDACHLIDLGFEGYPFTWSNGREEEENIQCRLDRALGTEEFINRFSPIKIVHLPRFGSDHAAVLTCLEIPTQWNNRRRKRLFRFEESWTKEDRCEELIRHNWNHRAVSCAKKLEGLKGLGSEFGDHNLGKIKKELTRIEEQMKDQNLWSESAEGLLRFKSLEKQHGEILKRQETMWRQRSRAVWLQDEDRNTKFFHNKASQRAKVNEIKKLKDEDGVW